MGASWQFTWKASSPAGYTNLAEMFAIFNNTGASGLNACYIRYNRASNLLYLADDAGTNWLGGLVPGTSGTAGNSQCSINGMGSWVSGAGAQLTLTVWVTFQSSFSGLKYNYLKAYDNAGLHSEWQQKGMWIVPDTPQYCLTTGASPSGGGTISLSPAGPCYTPGTVVSVSATPNSGYTFSGFSGDLTGTSTPQNLTMNAHKSVTANFVAQPNTITITSNPAGRSMTVDSVPCTSPCGFQWPTGSSHTIATTATQAGGSGTQYVFASWSDGGAISHSIVAPGSPATYTASFTTQHYLTTATSPPAGGMITPASGWYNAGTVASVSATAGSGYTFSGFSGDLSGTTTPQNLTMSGSKTVTASFAAEAPSFYLAPIANASAETGTSTHVSATVVPQNGFSSPVNFAYDPAAWPPSIAGTFNPFTVTTTSWTTTITISVLDSTLVGTYSLPIVTEGGGVRRTDYITLTVSRGSSSAGCEGSVTGISQITYYPDINTIETFSATALDYCTAAYYDAFVAGYLYEADTADPIRQGSDLSNPTAWGYMDAPASGGYDYELQSDHYVVAYIEYVYNVYGESVFRDPLGFSFMSTSPPPGPTGSGDYTPTYTDVFVIPQFLYLGTTAVWVPTSDQTPLITSISPDIWDAGATVIVTIGGTGFGYSGQLDVSGDGLMSWTILDWADTAIHASFTIHPEATPGGRTVEVISNGQSGLGFIPGPGQSARSNPATVTVVGSNCSVNIGNAGQKFSIGQDYLTATVPLLATSNCSGTVTWTIRFFYQTSGQKGTSTAGPFEVSANLNENFDYITPDGTGGRLDVTATITVNGKTTKQSAEFFVDGVQVPDQVITDRLVALYAGGGTPNLMTGIAMKESTYRQFSSGTLFGVAGRWPTEDYYFHGKYIGLMQVPVSMERAYNWEQNALYAVNLFAGQKLDFAGNYEARIRSSFPDLRPLTLQEHELNALVFYGPAGPHVNDTCASCPTGKLGAYWVPNAEGSEWVVNEDHKQAKEYVEQVLSLRR